MCLNDWHAVRHWGPVHELSLSAGLASTLHPMGLARAAACAQQHVSETKLLCLYEPVCMLSQNLSACSCNHSCSACSMNPHVVQGKLAHCLPWAHCYVNGFMALREAYWTSMQACLLTWNEIELYTGVNVPLQSFIWFNKLHTHTWSGWKNHWKSLENWWWLNQHGNRSRKTQTKVTVTVQWDLRCRCYTTTQMLTQKPCVLTNPKLCNDVHSLPTGTA